MAWFAEFSAARSFGFNHYVHALEQSRLFYVHALVFREAPVKPSGVSFVRWAKRDALPLAVAQLELIPHVVFVRTFTHVADAFLPTTLWTYLRRLRATISGFRLLVMGDWPPRAPASLGDQGRKLRRDVVANDLLDATDAFDGRLPELFCGFPSSQFYWPVPYPTACSPQAWASAAPLLLVRSFLGLAPHVQRTLTVIPHLPQRWGKLALTNLRLALRVRVS